MKWEISDGKFTGIATFYGFSFLIAIFNEKLVLPYILIVVLGSLFLMYLDSRTTKERKR